MHYKYKTLNDRTLEMVRTATLFFAPPASLNDPLELNAILHIDGNKEQVLNHFKQYREAILQNISLEKRLFKRASLRVYDGDILHLGSVQRHRSRSAAFVEKLEDANQRLVRAEESTEDQALIQLREFYELLLIEQRKGGICSMAGDPDNELMWAHYADEHRGICLEYEKDLFSTYVNVLKRMVKYSGTGIIDVFEHDYLTTSELLFSVKSSLWQYENETRFYLFGTPRSLAVSHRKFTSVILGYRFFSTIGLNDENLRLRRRVVKRLATTITQLNKVRQKGMKLRIKKVARTYFSFEVVECNTGEMLQQMFKFANG